MSVAAAQGCANTPTRARPERRAAGRRKTQSSAPREQHASRAPWQQDAAAAHPSVRGRQRMRRRRCPQTQTRRSSCRWWRAPGSCRQRCLPGGSVGVLGLRPSGCCAQVHSGNAGLQGCVCSPGMLQAGQPDRRPRGAHSAAWRPLQASPACQGSPTEMPLPRHMESGTRNMLAMQCSKPLQGASARASRRAAEGRHHTANQCMAPVSCGCARPRATVVQVQPSRCRPRLGVRLTWTQRQSWAGRRR